MIGKILAILIFFAGIILGLWLGLWVMFIGGIEQIVDGINVEPADGTDIAWGIVRIIFAAGIGWGSFLLCFLVSAMLWGDD